jgi:hypothetical protein
MESRLAHTHQCPDSLTDSMPSNPGAWIRTPTGTRRLLNDELAKGLGAPKAWWLHDRYPTTKATRATVALHILEALSPMLVYHAPQDPAGNDKVKDAYDVTPTDELAGGGVNLS